MARTAFKGINILIQIGIVGALAPAATYATTSHTTGGLKTITALANEPSALVFVPTGRSSDLHKQKSSERIKFHGGTETGDTFELDESIMGALNVVLCRDATNEAYYDPAIDLLLAAASESNKELYIRMERYIGFDSAALPSPGKHVYHVKAATIKVRSDNNAVNADAKQVETNFTLEGSGEWIEGYILK
jgi:hypothetical protein